MANETLGIHVSVASTEASHARIHVRGPISWDSHTKLGEQLDMAIGFGWRRQALLLDLGEVSFIDSSGISALLTLHREQTHGGGAVALFNVPPRVDQAFRLVGLGRIIPVAVTAEEARRALLDGTAGGPTIFTTQDQAVFAPKPANG